jgi:phage gpG-like protein
MAVSLSISVRGIKEVEAQLDRIDPKKNPTMVARALEDCAELTQIIAANQMIKSGGRVRGKRGPRGGRGKLTSAAAIGGKLTSRSGTLRRSIAVNRSPLPWAVEVGTDLVYGAVHEEGGTVSVPSYSRTIVGSTRSGGASVALVKAHTRTYPPRPFLAPALDKASKSFSSIFAREIAKEIR